MPYTLTEKHMATMIRSAGRMRNNLTSPQKRIRHAFANGHQAQLVFNASDECWHLIEFKDFRLVASHKLAAGATNLERLAAHWDGFVSIIQARLEAPVNDQSAA